MEVEDEVESRKKLDEQRKRLQVQLREVERFTDAPKEIQSSLKGILQQQLQEVEQRRNDLLPEHQRAQKKSQKIQSIQDKKDEHAKGDRVWWGGNAEDQGKTSLRKRSASVCCRTRSIRIEWQKRKWKRNFEDCRQEKKEEAATRRKQLIAAWRRFKLIAAWRRFNG